ncbi:MAG: hypothetical protein ACK41C_09530, partial [Phenylobacterium sp.]|uniref:hypothetical protein n=1 Tax=Phenylobacterium sp. TaxID=1871053 RepID=UPI003919CC7E
FFFSLSSSGVWESPHAAVFDSWPEAAKPLPPVPPAAMAFDISGATVTAGAERFTWSDKPARTAP